MQEAVYLEQVIPEYRGNPLIEALPPIWSPKDALKLLTVEPGFHESERLLDTYYRCHCVARLFSYFQPLDTHIDIEQRISRAIRQGYLNRNPLTGGYNQKCVEGYRIIKDKAPMSAYQGQSSSMGFTIIGVSGIGKTSSVEKVLSLYPQVITHSKYGEKPLVSTQIPWIKLDCPFDGSIKGLCASFFSKIDHLLDTDYSRFFTSSRMTVDSLLPRMTHLAEQYHIGLLIVDEIQHLSMAKSGGSDKMLNFFVTLVNTIGIPVILIGTTKALPILQGEFRQARRGSGQGDLLWDRMKKDVSWEIMLSSMWKYQWTKEKCPLTQEMRDTLYEESQGIIDIAVKLYAMSQIYAIVNGVEKLSAELFRTVAKESLQLVRPMLKALKSGDIKKISRFEDIRPIQVSDYIAAQISQIRLPEGNHITSLEEQAVIKLLELDVPAKEAQKAVRKIIKDSGKSGMSLASVVKKAFLLTLNITDAQELGKNAQQIRSDDLRKGDGTGYSSLKELGAIADQDEL